jgi:hypothetical protein
MDATNDFQLDADNATAFAGRLNVTGIGTSFQLQGGPWSGALILSIVFDRTGTGLSRVLVNGVSVGSGAYVTRLDSGQSLAVMTNRSRNAFIDGAAGEVIVTGSVSNTSDYVGYLLQKWGII